MHALDNLATEASWETNGEKRTFYNNTGDISNISSIDMCYILEICKMRLNEMSQCYRRLEKYIPKARLVEEPDNDGGGVIDCPGCTNPIGPAGDPDMLPIDP